MARRHEIDAFQKGDDSNTKFFNNHGRSYISWKWKNLKCLKSKSCIFRKSLKTMGNHAFPAQETMQNSSGFLKISRKCYNLKSSHFRCLALGRCGAHDPNLFLSCTFLFHFHKPVRNASKILSSKFPTWIKLNLGRRTLAGGFLNPPP